MKIYLYNVTDKINNKISFTSKRDSCVLVWDGSSLNWQPQKFDYKEFIGPELINRFSGPSLSDEVFLGQLNDVDLNKDMIIYVDGLIRAYKTLEEDEYEYVFQYGLLSLGSVEIANLESFDSIEAALLSVEVEFQGCTWEEAFGDLDNSLVNFSLHHNVDLLPNVSPGSSIIRFNNNYNITSTYAASGNFVIKI